MLLFALEMIIATSQHENTNNNTNNNFQRTTTETDCKGFSGKNREKLDLTQGSTINMLSFSCLVPYIHRHRFIHPTSPTQSKNTHTYKRTQKLKMTWKRDE